MIDFIKINYLKKNYPLPNDITDFAISVNNETGETDGKKTGHYFDMAIIKYHSERTLIKGSLHKFFNRTDFNGNDFDFKNLYNAIDNLKNDLNINPEYCKLENVEIGVNVQLPFNPNLVLQNLLFHRSTEFTKPVARSYYYQSAKNEYIIKIYNKAAQYQTKLTKIITELKNKNTSNGKKNDLEFLKKKIESEQKKHVIRFEVKFIKMNILNKLGVVYLSDLIKPEIIKHFKKIVLDEFQEVYFYDYTMDENNMKNAERIKIKDYRNPNYWKSLNKKDKYYHKNSFNVLTQKYSSDVKTEILRIISQKIYDLIDKSLDFLTDNFNQIKDTSVRLFDHSNIGVESPINTIEVKTQNKDENNRVCIVTGIDISMQKKDSKFLSFGGLKYYRENSPEVYGEIEKRYLSDKMQSRSLKEQIYYLAHNIRNSYTNPQHNPNHSRTRFKNRNYKPNQLQLFYE